MTMTSTLRVVNTHLSDHPFDVYDRVVSPKGRAGVVESIGWTGKSHWMQVRYIDTHRLVTVMNLDGWKRYHEGPDRGFEVKRLASNHPRHAHTLTSLYSDRPTLGV